MSFTNHGNITKERGLSCCGHIYSQSVGYHATEHLFIFYKEEGQFSLEDCIEKTEGTWGRTHGADGVKVIETENKIIGEDEFRVFFMIVTTPMYKKDGKLVAEYEDDYFAKKVKLLIHNKEKTKG
jgi:hypothetical protein